MRDETVKETISRTRVGGAPGSESGDKTHGRGTQKKCMREGCFLCMAAYLYKQEACYR